MPPKPLAGPVSRSYSRCRHSPPVALNVALLPRDPRFAREQELLSRLRHPSVPRLWDSGEWQMSSGALHPYLAMDWVDGEPLYDWAWQHAPSASQQLRVLAQLARALQALHAHGGVHRDVKGDNVLVRSDQRAFLTDFGAGCYAGATTLTPPDSYPGTPAYRAPESGLFELNSLRNRSARYSARPSDDAYALGVTACRLVTGEYPEFAEPT
ncbi:MAG TPA: serine/threonine-protein kinase [Hyalangium sp.]|nr:serine/threonine-protein kinase [Hyalangium sp.]